MQTTCQTNEGETCGNLKHSWIKNYYLYGLKGMSDYMGKRKFKDSKS